MPSNSNYLFNEYKERTEVINLIKTSVPIKIHTINFTKILNGHYSGEYAFYIKNNKNKNICIPFMGLLSDINDFGNF